VVLARVAELSFAERFCGPPGSANGGYACGSIAELLGGGVEVTLRRTCFTCGPDRAAGDGLRIFPGPASGSDLWAAPWTPDPSVADRDGLVAPEVVWAALDCPGGLAVSGGSVAVLGRMAAQVLARPRAGTAYCLVAWRDGPQDGRKLPAGSALLDGQGTVLAVARSVWVTIPRPEPVA
jgi:hypothetical protein